MGLDEHNTDALARACIKEREGTVNSLQEDAGLLLCMRVCIHVCEGVCVFVCSQCNIVTSVMDQLLSD